LGAKITKGQPLGIVHAGRGDKADAAERALRDAITVGVSKPVVPDLIHERIG
jgi:thymidine phosphorylase